MVLFRLFVPACVIVLSLRDRDRTITHFTYGRKQTMAKTAYDTIMELMICKRTAFNATFAYHHMLLVCGSGFLWDGTGRLVHDSEIDEKTDKCANKEENKEPYSPKKDHDAFINLLEKAVTDRVTVHLLDRTFERRNPQGVHRERTHGGFHVAL